MYTSDVGTDVNSLFSHDVQYEVPLYQRRYVWNETNWRTLWEDILSQLDPELEKNNRGHFIGSIVTRSIGGRQRKRFEIIDGQQRLTTFQIIFCVIRDLCESQGHGDLAKNVQTHLVNSDIAIQHARRNTSEHFPDPTYKLIPTAYDKLAFQEVVEEKYGKAIPQAFDELENRLNPEAVKKVRSQVFGGVDKVSRSILDAYDYFYMQITAYVGKDCNYNGVIDLITSIKHDFMFVPIVLDRGDQPEKIFESLNATGRMLSEFDYLRNNLFLRAGKAGEKERQRLYNEYWKHFENHEHYWDSETLELFLQHFLEAKLKCFQQLQDREVKAFDLYQMEYRKNLEKQDKKIDYEFAELKRYSEVYQKIDTHVRMQFYKLFDITGWPSFILFLIGEKKMNEKDLEQLLRVLESYAVRRMLCYGPKYKSPHTRDFLRNIANQISTSSDYKIEEFIRLLADRPKPYEWPDDSVVESSLQRYANNIDEDFLCYILYRIEFQNQENPSIEELSRLARKHVMPPRWEGTWSLPVGEERKFYDNLFCEDYKNNTPGWRHRPSEHGLVNKSEPYKAALRLALDRNYAVQSIGNLTIFEGTQAGMQLDFPKRKEYLSRSDLELNREICEYKSWGVEQIHERAENLIERFCKIWPSANSFIGELTGEELNAKSDKMIRSEPYRFITYQGIEEFSEIEMRQYDMVLTDGKGKKKVLAKHDILFAFPITATPNLKTYLNPIDTKVKNQNLTGVGRGSTQQVTDQILKGVQGRNSYMELVTRRGHVLCGVIEDFDLYCIYMQINGQTVIVYRHGLYGYKQLKKIKLDEMIQSESYVFITDKDTIKLSQIKPSPDKVTGSDENDREKTMNKRDILFACRAEAWLTVNNKIDCNQKEAQIRKSPGKIIGNRILQSARKNQFKIKAVTRCGDILRGIVENFDEIAIYLQIDGHTVIVFKHGVHKLSTPEPHKSEVKEFDKRKGFGFIQFGKKRSIFVHSSQVLDKSILPLKRGQKVEFNVEYTEKGLRAINVRGI